MESDKDNADKSLAQRLQDHWKDTRMTLSGDDVPPEIEGEEDFELDNRDIIRYGIHNEGSEYQRFICLRYVADDEVEAIRNTPTEDLEYDDCLMDKPMIFDMEKHDWVEQKGTINMIHDSAFVFYDDVDEFYDKLQDAAEAYRASGPAADGDTLSNG